MSSPPLYVLDANVFIEAAVRYYAFDLAPSFWNSLVEHGNAGRLCTIDRIADEVKNDAQLKQWMDVPFAGCVRASDTAETLALYAELMQWAQAQPFTDAAKTEFASVADAWLVAYAKSAGGIVVTHETYDANCKRRVKVPNACRHCDIPCVDTFAMLRSLGVTFR